MMGLEEIRSQSDLVDAIDWEMTPEEAVRLYLEWGNNWARSNYVIRSKQDVAHYFVINTWGQKPIIYLIRRNSEEALELAAFEMPADLEQRFLDSVGHHKGVWAVEGEVRDWLKGQLSVN
jgi:hypothetical protein